MMNTILLDRNVVASIKQKLAGKALLPVRDRALRLLDKDNNFISPILSIREGQLGIRENTQEHKLTLLKETDAISQFFKRAKTDSKYLIDKIDEFSTVFADNIEHNWRNYIAFVKEMQSLLYQPVSKKEKDDFKKRILKSASAHNILHTHPAVLCALSVLYGCNETRKILKPKKNRSEESVDKNAYNTMNDLIVLSRVHMIQAIEAEQGHQKDKIKFFTFDKGLEFFLNCIKTKKLNIENSTKNSSTISEIICHPKLFPELNKSDFNSLMKTLQESYNKSNAADAKNRAAD